MRRSLRMVIPLSLVGLVAACGGGSDSTLDDPLLPSASVPLPTPAALVADVGSTLATPDGVSVAVQSVSVNDAAGVTSWEPEQEEEPVDLPEGAVWPVDGYRVALTTEVTNNSSAALSIPTDFVTLEVTPSDAEGFKILCTPVSIASAPDEQPGVAVGAIGEVVSRFVCPGQRAEEPFEAIYSVPPAATRLIFAGELPFRSTTDATAGQPD